MFQVIRTTPQAGVLGGWYRIAADAVRDFAEYGGDGKFPEVCFRSVNSLVLTVYKSELTYAYIKEVNDQPGVEHVCFVVCDFEQVSKELEMFKYHKGSNSSSENRYYTKVTVIDLSTGKLVATLVQ